MIEPIGEVLALDPSIRSIGVALFRGGELAIARTIKVEQPDPPVSSGERWLRAAQEVVAWVHDCRAAPRALVAEVPQWYPSDRSKVDPNDLAGLAGVVGAVAGLLSGLRYIGSLEVRTFLPAEWLHGQLPKAKSKRAADNPRAHRILGRLSQAEAARMADTNHDTIDAVGIGLHAFGRLEPARRFPGASIG